MNHFAIRQGIQLKLKKIYPICKNVKKVSKKIVLWTSLFIYQEYEGHPTNGVTPRMPKELELVFL